MRLLLKNVVWHDREGDHAGDLRLARGRILASGRGLCPRRWERVLDLQGFRALPGLINAHDHLSLNLLPHLGDPPYASLYHFAEAVHDPGESPVRETQSASVADRLWWGGYKNLISGVTTVVHHDPFPRRVLLHPGFPVHVLRRYGWSHSLHFGDNPAAAFEACADLPFIIHAAEGVDAASHQEITRLHELGMLSSRTVIVHGIAMTNEQLRLMARARASLVWCPVSNLRLYGRTAAIDQFGSEVRIALGTDSTLTGSTTLFDEMRAAVATGLANGSEVLEMVTATAADIFHLSGRGRIVVGNHADLLIVADPGDSPADRLLRSSPADPALVLAGGKVGLARPEFAAELGLGPPNVRLAGEPRWLCGSPVRLRQRIEAAVGSTVLARHPLWALLEPC